MLKYLCMIFSWFSMSSGISQEAVRISSDEFDNLYKVSNDLYRSGQPSKEGFRVLDSLGIETVLSLRNRVSDQRKAREVSINLKRVKINSWRMSYHDLVVALKAIDESEKPVLVHCLHGSDRTGAVIAAYRMVFQNWPKEKAIDEFLAPQFGYHEFWFPDILELLQDLSIEKLRSDVISE